MPGVCLALFATASLAGAASPSQPDRQFLVAAAHDDMIEANQAQMAETQATRSDVKDLARTVDQDHRDSYWRLGELASKTGVTIPRGIDSGKDTTISELRHLKGTHFDSQFARDQVAADQREIAMFKREADYGRDPDVKAYAAKMIPVLEKDLHLAQECLKPGSHS
jgi:putative membrane protein